MFEFFHTLEETLSKLSTHEKESKNGVLFDGIKKIIKNFGEVFFPPRKK